MIPFRRGLLSRGGIAMQRVDGFYLYTLGNQIHPLSDFRYDHQLKTGTTMGDAFFPLLIAEGALEPLLSRSVFQLRTSQLAGNALLTAVRAAKQEAENANDASQPLGFLHTYAITSALGTFEAVLNAELALLPLYLVTQKAGFDTGILIEKGVSCFPADIVVKVPEACPDLQQGTKCIAFDLPTAAGFHLHRANESILHRYWDAVTGGVERPVDRNIGIYLREMDKLGVGDEKVKAALRDIKNFHRNPLIHPEHTLDHIDQAIALMNSIHTVTVYMLQTIPGPVTQVLTGALTQAS